MHEQPTWEDIKREAANLEIWFGERGRCVDGKIRQRLWLVSAEPGRATSRLDLARADKTGDRAARPVPQSRPTTTPAHVSALALEEIAPGQAMCRKREPPSPDQPVLVARDSYAVSPPRWAAPTDSAGQPPSGHSFSYR